MGVIVSPNNPVELADGIRRALLMPQRTGEQGRERIISLFPKSRREQRLLQLMKDLS
jgi:glycosyltransferase involved in cell wall biosynthesis